MYSYILSYGSVKAGEFFRSPVLIPYQTTEIRLREVGWCLRKRWWNWILAETLAGDFKSSDRKKTSGCCTLHSHHYAARVYTVQKITWFFLTPHQSPTCHFAIVLCTSNNAPLKGTVSRDFHYVSTVSVIIICKSEQSCEANPFSLILCSTVVGKNYSNLDLCSVTLNWLYCIINTIFVFYVR